MILIGEATQRLERFFDFIRIQTPGKFLHVTNYMKNQQECLAFWGFR